MPGSRMMPTLRRWRRTPLIAYGAAVLSVAAAVLLRWALGTWIGVGMPFITFFPAIMVATFIGGLWPGVAAWLLSSIAAWYFFMDPPYTFGSGLQQFLSLAVFFVVGGLNVAIIQLLNDAVDRIELLADQRNLLLNELRHRISNNLQLVSSLLNLRQNSVDDPHARQALIDASQQLAFIGKLHRHLHDPTRPSLDFGKFVDELCRDLLAAGGAGHIQCQVSSVPLSLSNEQSIPLGLIAAELVSNALEHAFVDRENGLIRIEIARDGEEGVLIVSDDGRGLPPEFQPEKSNTFGMRIIHSLVQQLGGRFEFSSASGASFRLTFPLVSKEAGLQPAI